MRAPASGRSIPYTTGMSCGRRSRARRSRPGPPRSGATRRCSRSRACRAAARAGSHAARRRPAARERARRRRAVPEARHRQSDPLVQGPRRRGRLREGARARRDDARVLLDRQPRERGRRARSGRGDRGRGPLPGRPRAREASATAVYGATIYAVDGSYDDCCAPERRALLRARLGVRQRRAPFLLRGGLEDGRLRDRRAARLEAPVGSRVPDRFGCPLLEGAPGFLRAPRARARRRRRSAPLRRASGRLRARRRRLRGAAARSSR